MAVRFEQLAAVLPVRDIEAGMAHYRALGFEVERYAGSEPYAFVTRDDVHLHLTAWAEMDPATNSSAVYLRVDDADALHADWERAGVGGRLVAPTDTEYGLREGAHLDPDGNLLRFGSPLG